MEIKKFFDAMSEEFAKIPAQCSEEDVEMLETMVSMPDGVGLKTFIFRQKNVDFGPVLFTRTCYPHAREIDFFKARGLAARGFASVIQYCRGTGGSEGVWEPNVNERPDGICAMNWLAKQPWVESIGYYGASYLALTGWAMIDCLPEKVKGMYLSVYGANRHVSAFNDGLFRQDILTSWAMGNAGVPVDADFMESCRYQPQVHVDEALWGIKLPWYEQMICSTNSTDTYWQEGFWNTLRNLPAKVNIPVVIEEGWYDHHLGSALWSYRAMSDAGKDRCMLRIGPWNHSKMCALTGHEYHNDGSNQVTDIYTFFHALLMENTEPEYGVSLYQIGEDRWINTPCWPEPEYVKTLYLDTADKTLKAQVPQACGEISYTYDPENPVPSFGAESCFVTQAAVGSRRQPEPDYREDVISFISEPFSEPMRIVGCLNLDLYVSSDAEDTAFSVKLMEVFENGETYNIRSGITTLAYRGHSQERQTYTPGTVVKANVDTWDIAWTIQKNSRIRVDISSSDFPQYTAHSNYAGIWALQEKNKIASQTIYSGKDYPSALNIPLTSAIIKSTN